MKRIYLLLLILSSSMVYSQQINTGEYFFGDDPGVGNGTPINFTAGSNVTTTLSVPVTSLTEGFQNISVRFKNNDGHWGQYAQRAFYVMAVPVGVPEFTAAEYFFDHDPGVGNGNELALSASGNTINESVSIPVPSIDNGFHTLVIRTKNENGQWSHYAQRTFYIMTDAIDAQTVVSVEYFIDTDPGVGAGAPLNINTTGGAIQQTFIIPTSSGLSNGTHYLYVRVKSELEKWSVTAMDSFVVDQSLPVSGMELSGVLHEQKVLLNWFTITEANTKTFEVERSANGISFAPIGNVKAAGNSVSQIDYQFTDLMPLEGINYYRLKLVDKDGRTSYSNIIVINNLPASELFTIYPNPASNSIRLKLPGTNSPWTVSLYDVRGRFLRTEQTLDGMLNITSLAKGSYFVAVTNGVKQYYGQFIKK